MIHYNIILHFRHKVNLFGSLRSTKNSDFFIGVLFIYAKILLFPSPGPRRYGTFSKDGFPPSGAQPPLVGSKKQTPLQKQKIPRRACALRGNIFLSFFKNLVQLRYQERIETTVGLVQVNLGDNLHRRVHAQNRYADVDGVDIQLGDEFCNGAAAALVNFAQLA